MAVHRRTVTHYSVLTRTNGCWQVHSGTKYNNDALSAPTIHCRRHLEWHWSEWLVKLLKININAFATRIRIFASLLSILLEQRILNYSKNQYISFLSTYVYRFGIIVQHLIWNNVT